MPPQRPAREIVAPIFRANTQPHQATRVVKLVVRHWPHQVRHSGRQALCTTADAPVVDERGGVWQQFAERDETKVAHCVGQLPR